MPSIPSRPGWRWRNRLASHGLRTGPAWRGIDRFGRRPRATRMTTQAIGHIITHRAAVAGLKGDVGGHSLRRGFAVSALAGGATDRLHHLIDSQLETVAREVIRTLTEQ